MNKNSAALAFVVALGACASAPASWYKESALPDQVDRDLAQCERQARASAPGYSSPTNRGINAGSGSGVGDGLANAERQSGLANDCMRAKGYTLR